MDYHVFIRYFFRTFSALLHQGKIKLLLYNRAKRCYDLVTNEIGNDRLSGQMKPTSVEVGFCVDTVTGDGYVPASKISAGGSGLP
jgi:hypothetical protein